MKYDRFEQLPVWQAAMELAERVYALTRRRPFARLPELRDQVRRAALSVSNNIAEGFERGTTAELLSFLYIARGSAGEVRSMLLFMERLFQSAPAAQGHSPHSAPAAANLKSEISDLESEIAVLRPLAESCSRQLRAWADQLQNSDIEGPRRMTDRSRTAWHRRRSAAAFMQRMKEMTDAARGTPPPESDEED